jgi:hypothetical protein
MAAQIQTVHLIFKTHLDIGYTDYSANVVNQYFTDFIPRALQTAREMRERGGPERFRWTTGSWLIYEYLETASPEQRAEMEAAILAGDILWHALPFTTHTELMDPALFNMGLSLARELDQRFGRVTTAAKMTDVPGHTRGIIPLLAAAGVRFLHIGVNDGSTMPQVPPVFRWKGPAGVEIVVMYEQGYGHAATVPGLEHALAFGHTIDNLGPQSPDEVRQVWSEMQTAFPGAQVVASTLDDFADALLPLRESLPVVTAEIGDSWIHGAGSDPLKLARFRALQRLHTAWRETGVTGNEVEAIGRFARRLILVPEHTWGMDEKVHLADHENYAAAQFARARSQPNYQKFEASWAEQRAYIDQALSALKGTPLHAEAQAALANTVPQRPEMAQWKRVANPAAIFETQHFNLRFDMLSGAINYLRAPSGRDWAAGSKLGWFRYQTFSKADYDRFFLQYIRHQFEAVMAWAVEDYGKVGMESATPEHRWWLPQNVDLFQRADDLGKYFLLQLSFPARSTNTFGCPHRVFLEWAFPYAAPEACLTVRWFEKQACRLPEALWVSFVPKVSPAVLWQMDKLGQMVDPLDVVPAGGSKLHGLNSGLTLRDGSNGLEICTLDAALVAPGEPSLLDFSPDLPRLVKGAHFNLYNNTWGTNFPMWYEDDGQFRFSLREVL